MSCAPYKDTDRICREFQRYLVRHKIHGTYLAVNLNRIIREWLAGPQRREHLELEIMPVHEQIALVASIESSFRARWQAKGSDTRKKTAQRKKVATDALKQLSLNL